MVNEDKIDFHYQAFFSPPDINIEDYIEKIKLKKFPNVHLQLVDPSFIVSKRHIKIAIYHTQKIFKQNRNIARDQSTEFLLRISGKKQISSSLEIFGVKATSKIILLVAFGGTTLENKETVDFFIQQINIAEEKQIDIQFPILSIEELSQHYNCESNIDKIERCVLEKIALLTIS